MTTAMTTPTRRRPLPFAAACALGAAFAAAPAAARTQVMVGSASETAGESEWTLGIGYDFDFPALPFSVGVLGQTGVGRREASADIEARRTFPARGFGVVKVGLLPAPGFGVHLGAGAGVAARFRAVGADRSWTPAGIALAGFSAGRVSLEVQYQRDFAEEPVNRWVYLLGVAF